MKIDLKEIEWFSLVSMIIGISAFMVICIWDDIVSMAVFHSQIAYHKGYGSWQILGMASSGLYSMWSLAIRSKWNSYNKMIHNLKGA